MEREAFRDSGKHCPPNIGTQGETIVLKFLGRETVRDSRRDRISNISGEEKQGKTQGENILPIYLGKKVRDSGIECPSNTSSERNSERLSERL